MPETVADELAGLLEPGSDRLALVDVTRTELLDSPLYGDVDRDLDAIDLELMDLSFEMNTL